MLDNIFRKNLFIFLEDKMDDALNFSNDFAEIIRGVSPTAFNKATFCWRYLGARNGFQSYPKEPIWGYCGR